MHTMLSQICPCLKHKERTHCSHFPHCQNDDLFENGICHYILMKRDFQALIMNNDH